MLQKNCVNESVLWHVFHSNEASDIINHVFGNTNQALVQHCGVNDLGAGHGAQYEITGVFFSHLWTSPFKWEKLDILEITCVLFQLLKMVYRQQDELRKLKDELGEKDKRIRQLELELKNLRNTWRQKICRARRGNICFIIILWM